MNEELKREITNIIKELNLNCFVDEFKTNKNINWYWISEYQKLTESFIREHKDSVDWNRISRYQKLTESFIREHKDLVDWNRISRYQKLTESFIREHKDSVDWYCISGYQKLTESFIREHKDSVDWYCISRYQKLTESFIREHKDSVDWYCISEYQKLTESFIREHKDSVDWNCISRYQYLSEEFIKEFDLKIDDDNWLYKDIEFKKQQIINSNLYECYDDYFLAYKSIRIDNYSVYNFQYQYFENQIYESHSDYTNEENSFGLSVWTKEKALEYHSNGKLLLVKIKYSDVSRIVHDNGKIRTRRLEVLKELEI